MTEQDGKIGFVLQLDNSQMRADAAKAIAAFRSIGNAAEAEGSRIDKVFSKATSAIGTAFAGVGVGSFIRKMFQIRSEFQDTESSMRVFLGSAEKAANFMKKLQDYAWYNMFEFKDLTVESSKLLAYGNDVEKVIPILDKLSNVAAGTQRPLSDIVDLYNKAKNIGKVDAQALNSWAANGLVITDVLKEMGVEVDRSSVKFEHLEKALNHVTAEGGRFHGLMNEQLGNLSASWGQLQDELSTKLNEFGKKLQDVFKSGIDSAAWFVKNSEEIGKTILELVAAYGVYRAALIAVSAAQKVSVGVAYSAEIAELTKLVAVKKASSDADIQAAVTSGKLTEAKAAQLVALRAEVNAKLKAMQVEAAKAAVEVRNAKQAIINARLVLIEKKAQVTAAKHELAVATASGNAKKIATAQTKLDTAVTASNTAVRDLRAKKVAIETVQETAQTKAKAVNTLQTNINTASTTANSTATNLLTAAKARLIVVMNRLKASLLTNPYLLVAAAVAALAYGIYKLATAETAAEKAQREYNEYLEKAKEKKEALVSKTNELIRKIQDETLSIYEQIKAWKALKKEMPEVFGDISFEGAKNLTPEEVNKRTNEAADAREWKDAQEKYDKAQKKVEEINKKIKNGADSYALIQFNKQLQFANEELKVVKKGLDDIVQLRKEAEFAAKPTSEKLQILNAELEALQKQRAEIDKILLSSEETGFAWNNLFDRLNNEVVLDNINTKIKETQGRIKSLETTGQDGVRNKAFWEKRKEEAETARAALDVSKQNSDEWNTYTKQIEEAQKQIDKYSGPSKEKRKDFTDELQKNLRKELRFYEDLEYDNTQLKIDLREDGFEKELAQLKLNHEKRITEINRQEEDWLDTLRENAKKEWEASNPDWEKQGLKFENSDIYKSLPAKLEVSKALYKQLRDETNKEYSASTKKLLDNLISEYGSYYEKRKVIEEKWESEIAQLPEQYKSRARAERDKELQELEERYVGATTLIGKLFADTSKKSVKEMKRISDSAKVLLKALKSGQYDSAFEENFGITEDQFKLLLESKEEINKITNAVEELDKAIEKTEPILKKFSTALSNVIKNFKSGDAKSFNDNLRELSEIIGSANDAAKFIGESFEALSAFTTLQGLGDIASTMEHVTNTIDKMISGASIGAEIGGGYGALAGAIVGLITGIAQAISEAADDDEIERIKALQRQIRYLDYLYSQLERDVAKAYSHDAVKLINQEIENLQAQQKLIQEQIIQEKRKKEVDDDAIEQYREAYRGIELQIAELKDKTIDVILGEDVQSSIDSFAQAYADAWSTGEDKAKAMKDVVKNMIKNIVKRAMMMDLSGAVQQIRDKAAEFFIDDVISAYEQQELEKLAENAADNLSQKYSWADELFKDDAAREASKKGFASMNQDTANELNGRFAIMTEFTRSINENSQILVTNSEMILQHLSGIRDNTEFCRRLDGMDADLRAVKQGIDTINLKGVLIRA